jgi:hypothetical protein
VGKRKRADVYLEVRKKRGNIFFEWNKCLWRYPKIASNKPPHCIFFSHIYIFRSVKSVCNVRQWGFPICPQTFRREWRSSKRFLLPDFLAFSLVSFKKYIPPLLPYFKVNICPFPLPHFASIFFAYLWSFRWPRYFSFRLPHLNIPTGPPSDELDKNIQRTPHGLLLSHWNGYSHFRFALDFSYAYGIF